MDPIILQAEKSEKLIAGEKYLITPVVIALPIGFGLILKQDLGLEIGVQGGLGISESNWQLIKYYRAMMVASRLFDFGHEPGETLRACLITANRDINSENIRYFKNIEGIIGKSYRDELLEMVPPNLDGVLSRLKEHGVYVDTNELELEILLGALERTPAIESYLAEVKEKQEFVKQEESGRIVTAEEAMEKITEMASHLGLGSSLVNTFLAYTDSDSFKAVKFSPPGRLSAYYLVGKYIDDKAIEITLSTLFNSNPSTYSFASSLVLASQIQMSLEVGITYGTNDTDFQQKTSEEVAELKIRERAYIADMFPIAVRKYGASIKLKQDLAKVELKLNIVDPRVEDAARKFYVTLNDSRITENFSAIAKNTTPPDTQMM